MLQKQNVNEEKKKKKKLYGDEKRQVSLALDIAWTDYYNLSMEQEPDKKRIMHYENVIHNFERKLGRPRTLFSIYKMLAWAFCWYNPELFKEGVTEALVKKGMMKTVAIVESRMPLDKRPNIVQDRIRSYREWRKYIAEVSTIRI
jgi:hypothetical protein